MKISVNFYYINWVVKRKTKKINITLQYTIIVIFICNEPLCNYL